MVKEKSPLDFSIFGWCIALSFAPQFVFSFIVSVLLAINGQNVWETDDPQIEVMVLLGATVLSPLLFFPLLRFVADSKSYLDLLSYLRFKSVKLTHLCLVVIFTVLLEFSFDFFSILMKVPFDPFTIVVKEFANTYEKIILVIIAICVIAPLMEEIIFRGWLFQRLSCTKFGNIGAVGISSILFTLFHFQYNQITPIIILLIYSFVLGIVRLKTANINYTIIAHMISNSYVVFAPIWFN